MSLFLNLQEMFPVIRNPLPAVSRVRWVVLAEGYTHPLSLAGRKPGLASCTDITGKDKCWSTLRLQCQPPSVQRDL